MMSDKRLRIAVGFLFAVLTCSAVAKEGGSAMPSSPTQGIKRPLPDLVALNAAVTQQTTKMGMPNSTINYITSVHAKVSVKNASSTASGRFKIRIKYGKKWENGSVDHGVMWADVSFLGGNSAKVIDKGDMLYYSAPGAFPKELKSVYVEEVMVDANNAVAESNESNNKWPRRK